jgi:formylmethanofuran dehydrogenase subunit E
VDTDQSELPDDLNQCMAFHGHLCPGLVYGYLVAKEAVRLLSLHRSKDEEVVAISENDSCAVDALQVVLGTSAGKGNLVLNNFGKNVYTILSRKEGKAFRFSRKTHYCYEGEDAADYEILEKKIAGKTASKEDHKQHKLMKSLDLLRKNFSDVFTTEEIAPPEQPYAQLAPSAACSLCGEMTMATRLVDKGDLGRYCIPCAQRRGFPVSLDSVKG